MNVEYRRAKRRKAAHEILILDTMTEEYVGKIGNLSESGVLMVTNRPLTSDALFQFRFELTTDRDEKLAVEVGAHELWADEAAAPGQVWSGLRFIDISPESLSNIRVWVNQPGSDYV